jgi:sortase B
MMEKNAMTIEYRRTERAPLASRKSRKAQVDRAEKSTNRAVERAVEEQARESATFEGASKPKKRNWGSLLLLLIGLALMAYALFQLGSIWWAYHTAAKAFAELTEEFAPPVVEDDFNDYEEMLAAARKRVIDFKGLQALNPEVVGWIFIPGTRIDYPVMHSGDNEFYLKHDFEGNFSEGGSIFLEAINKPDFSEADSRIYGHNMYDRSMFGSLPDYRKTDFAAYYTHIFLYTPEETKEFLYSSQGLITPDGLEPFTSDNPDERIITLVTCEYDFADARFFVRANIIARFEIGGAPIWSLKDSTATPTVIADE